MLVNYEYISGAFRWYRFGSVSQSVYLSNLLDTGVRAGFFASRSARSLGFQL